MSCRLLNKMLYYFLKENIFRSPQLLQSKWKSMLLLLKSMIEIDFSRNFRRQAPKNLSPFPDWKKGHGGRQIWAVPYRNEISQGEAFFWSPKIFVFRIGGAERFLNPKKCFISGSALQLLKVRNKALYWQWENMSSSPQFKTRQNDPILVIRGVHTSI